MKLNQSSTSYHSSLCTWGLLLLFCEGEAGVRPRTSSQLQGQHKETSNHPLQQCNSALPAGPACTSLYCGRELEHLQRTARSGGELHVHIMLPQGATRVSTHVRGLVSFRGPLCSCLHDRRARGEKVPAYVGM